MPGTETVMINGNAVVIEKIITSGDLIIASLQTIIISIMIGAILLHMFGGRR